MAETQQEQRFLDWLADALVACGTRFSFGVPGGGASLDLLLAMQQRKVRNVICAREDAAVIMASVAGVLARAPGLAFTTKGPGVSSATNGIACAALDRFSPLVIGEAFVPSELSFLSHQYFDQSALVAPLLARDHAASLEPSPHSVSAWLQDGAWPPRGPAVLFAESGDYAEPANSASFDASAVISGNRAAQLALRPELEVQLKAAASSLAKAKRPVVVLGLEASRGLAPATLARLVEVLQAPVLCTYMAKGVLPDVHPQWAGVFTGGAIEQQCVREADLIVAIGIDPVELIRKPWPYEVPMVELCEEIYTPHYYAPKIRAVAPLNVTVERLHQLLDGPVASLWMPAQVSAHRERFLDALRISPTHSSLAAASPDSSMVVSVAAAAFAGPLRPRVTVDAGAHMFSACAFWPCEEPLDLLISNGLATMGFALPAAIAAALHEPERGALAFTGDGGLLMCLGELKTAAEMQANVCVVVFNDARLSLIDIKREDRQMPDLDLSWRAPNFAEIAQGCGLQGWRVENATQLEAALTEAAACSGPCLVDVRVESAGYRQQLQSLRG